MGSGLARIAHRAASMRFRRSSSTYSTHDGECVEVATRTGTVVARGSKVVGGPVFGWGPGGG
ncbi:DUF397 domain-containing protein [Streptomyces sp. SID3343]|nr:DUF397 domain-containing protein [Streptomyces sp. SID3343]